MRNTYRQKSLYSLLQAVAEEGDRAALSEFHDHRGVFCWNEQEGLRCAEFLDRLRQSAAGSGFGWADEAYQHCLDKFSNLPGERNRTDCRLYFRPVLERVSAPMSALKREERLAHVLQGQVATHFRLSCKDRMRTLGGFSRYTWNLQQGTLPLMLPRTLTGSERRAWLEAEVPDADATREGERERVQRIIDEHFGRTAESGYCDGWAAHQPAQPPLPWELAERLESARLPAVVAQEKTLRLDEQRPAIRRLGSERLHELILAAFENVVDREQTDEAMAARFALSKASYSRFAGRNWSRHLPDLWRNTAGLLAHHPTFRELAERSGLRTVVHRIAQST